MGRSVDDAALVPVPGERRGNRAVLADGSLAGEGRYETLAGLVRAPRRYGRGGTRFAGVSANPLVVDRRLPSFAVALRRLAGVVRRLRYLRQEPSLAPRPRRSPASPTRTGSKQSRSGSDVTPCRDAGCAVCACSRRFRDSQLRFSRTSRRASLADELDRGGHFERAWLTRVARCRGPTHRPWPIKRRCDGDGVPLAGVVLRAIQASGVRSLVAALTLG